MQVRKGFLLSADLAQAGLSHRGGAQEGRHLAGADAERAFIRTWTTAVFHLENHRLAALGVTGRWLVRALAEAAHKTGSRWIGFGTRSLAIATGGSHVQVAADLKTLTTLGWVDKIRDAHGTDADQYILTLPDDVAGRADELRWHAGRVHARRPAFRDTTRYDVDGGLGGLAGLVFEAVELGYAITIAEIVTHTGLSRSAVTDAVTALLAHGALTRAGGVLVAHPQVLGRIAEDLGAYDDMHAQIRTYARHRQAWHAYLQQRSEQHGDDVIRDGDLHDPEIDEWWLPPDGDVDWIAA